MNKKIRKYAFSALLAVILMMSMFVAVACQHAIRPVSTRGSVQSLSANDREYSGALGHVVSSKNYQSRVHYIPSDAWVGDPHPVYFNGKWHVYYLELPYSTNDRNSLQGLRQGLITSTDLINWTKEEVSINNGKMWFAISNTIYNGEIYSICGAMDENIYLTGGLGLSTSSDGKEFRWDGVVYSTTQFICDHPKDPAVFYDEREQLYYLIYSGYGGKEVNPNSQGAMYYSTTKDFTRFSDSQPLYDLGNARLPECPEMFELGGKYYLSVNYGMYRTGTARYFVADSPTGPFKKTQINTFSSYGLVTPNSYKDDSGKLVTFGWVNHFVNKQDGNGFLWGGNLGLPRELYQSSDGETLYARPAFDSALIRDGKLYGNGLLVNYIKGDGWSFNEQGDLYYGQDASCGEVWLDAESEYFDMEFTLRLGEDNTGAGVVLKAGNGDYFDGYEIFIDPVTNRLILRNHLVKEEELTFVPIEAERNKDLNIRVILDGDILEVFYDNRFTLTERVYRTTTNNYIGLFSDYGSAAFEDIEIYELANVLGR